MASKQKKGNHSDEYLVHQFCVGNQSMFEEIFLRHHRKVYYLALKYLKNDSIAEDVTQDVFI